ncbi:arylesterase [Devosia chinhatensis]|nr:arylesterase [Devosia chinhatensis]
MGSRWWQAAIGAMAVSGMLAATGPLAAAERPTILLYGDSLLAGFGLSADSAFLGQLQAALAAEGVEADLVNASVSGDTTADGLARLDWTLGEPPDAVMLGLGANDMLQGLSPQTARANLETMMDRFAALDLPVLLLGMKANRGLGGDYVAAFDAIYPELAAEYGALLYPFFLEGVAFDPQMNQADGMHPNAAGVARIVAAVTPYVVELVKAVEAR